MRSIFVATNRPAELENITAPLGIVFAGAAKFRHRMRFLDSIIVEMVILALADGHIFNRFSSFSATAYEAATIHDRIDSNKLFVW